MTLPAWLTDNPGLLNVLETWFTDRSLKGEVRLYFRHGDLTRIEPAPVIDGAALKSARRAKDDTLLCPQCRSPMDEFDYGDKLSCRGCGNKWLRRKVEQWQLTGEVFDGKPFKPTPDT